MLEHLRAPFKKLIEPIAKALIAIGLTANAVTVIGAVGTIVVAIATGVTGWLFGGAVVLTLLVLSGVITCKGKSVISLLSSGYKTISSFSLIIIPF